MRYLKVLGVFYKAAILTDLEYRANLVTNVLMSSVAALATGNPRSLVLVAWTVEPVHGLRVTAVQLRTRCSSCQPDLPQ